MSNGIEADTPEIWGTNASTDSAIVERDYEAFSKTGVYDETFADWGYVGPETAAALMRNFVPLNSKILDAACGSGLTGRALQTLGYDDIHGIDISPSLLEEARRSGAYKVLTRVDMQSLPLPIEDGSFDAVNFIGALSYFEGSDILRELCRVTVPGGHIVFSQRDDLMRDLNYEAQLRELEVVGLWRRVFSTDPLPYLPNHPQYGSSIRVQYFVYEVS
ncbi:Methyltransferase domain family protein [gamma proteobacterium NOR5-3]|nr:Methyltransferase domain family protein [gamma proteobacterium NOR5-3]